MILQKFTIDSFKSLDTLFELGLFVEFLNTCEFESGFGLIIVGAGNQDDSMLVAEVLLSGYADTVTYSNLLPSVLPLHRSFLLRYKESFLILRYLRSVPLSIRDLLSFNNSSSFWHSWGVRSGFM